MRTGEIRDQASQDLRRCDAEGVQKLQSGVSEIRAQEFGSCAGGGEMRVEESKGTAFWKARVGPERPAGLGREGGRNEGQIPKVW